MPFRRDREKLLAERYLYVLSGYAGPDPLGTTGRAPAFEFQRFVQLTGADLLSLSTVRPAELGLRTKLAPRLLLDRLRLALLVARRCGDYDAVIASGEDIGVLVALMMRTLGRTTPLVIITHGPQFTSGRFRRVVSLIRSMRNVVFACLSRSLSEWLVTHHGMDPDRCLAVGYGVDADFFASVKGRTAEVVVSAGVSHRDYDTLIDAVTGTGLDTRIAADSTWVGKTASTNKAVPDHVGIRSYGNYERLRELYREARVVVVPTHDVPFAAGLAVIGEAMATGTAVVASKGRVTSDFVIDGVTGILVPPGDAGALRSAITSLIENPDLAATMGAAAADRIATSFSLDRYVERLRRAVDHAG